MLYQINNKKTFIQKNPMTTLKFIHPDISKELDDGVCSNQRCLQPERSNQRDLICGKVRGWNAQSLKILENLMSLENAKLMWAPLDPISHQDYYCMNEDPLDFSKIMLKLHSGKYQSFIEFRQDIEQMFDEYKRYFSIKDIKIFNKIEDIEAYIDSKLDKIINKTSSSNDVEKLDVLPNCDMLSERIQKIQEENERVLNQATIPKTIFKSKISSENITQQKFDNSISYTFRTGDNRKQIIIPNQKKLSQPPVKSPQILFSKKNSSMESEFLDELSGQVDRCLEREMEKAGVQLLLNVSSIWFGACRQLPIAPIIIRENGFYMRFLIEDREDTLVDFQIPAHEIVRCCGYHGSKKKHTIFIFLLPSCISRMIDSKLVRGMDASPASSYHSTLIALFMPALRDDDMAKLIYLLWSMGKQSLFKSTDFYSEIDEAVALKLMSNTNPNINKRIQVKQSPAVAVLKARKRNSPIDLPNLKRKKEKSTDCDSALIPLLCVHG